MPTWLSTHGAAAISSSDQPCVIRADKYGASARPNGPQNLLGTALFPFPSLPRDISGLARAAVEFTCQDAFVSAVAVMSGGESVFEKTGRFFNGLNVRIWSGSSLVDEPNKGLLLAVEMNFANVSGNIKFQSAGLEINLDPPAPLQDLRFATGNWNVMDVWDWARPTEKTSGHNELAYSFVGYIPFLGALYSFRRMPESGAAGETKEAWVSAVNLVQGFVRDTVLCSGTEDILEVMILHAVAESVSDKAVKLLASPGSATPTRIDVGSAVGDKLKAYKPDKHSTHVLIPGKSKEDCDKAIEKLQRNTNFRGAILLHRAVYCGKFNYSTYAQNENLFLTFPTGIHDGAPCTIFTTFTIKANRAKREMLTCIRTPISIDPRESMFSVPVDPEVGYYQWKGKLEEGGRKIILYMLSQKETVATINLELQTGNMS